MRRVFILPLLILVASFAMLAVRTAEADGGPHEGDFTSTTDACAGCHRVHRGQAPDLLTETSQQALCYSCHGTAATGADTNVEDGVYQLRGSGGIYGTVGDGLRGGGFANALMNPGMLAAGPSSASVTSNHGVGASGTIWGNGAIDSGAGKTGVTLECGSCHNPHGISDGDNYRVLRPKPKNSGAGAEVNVPDEVGIKTYTITYLASDYRDTSYLAAADISSWCSQCHTRYLSNNTGDSGDAIFTYRHRTDNKSCLNCHVAHGTSATMATFSGAVEWPDGSPVSGENSRLLSVNNRGTCVQCHPSP